MDLTECLSMDKDFKINILSSAVSTDGHEIENIFNEKGFMAERFVKVGILLSVSFVNLSPCCSCSSLVHIQFYILSHCSLPLTSFWISAFRFVSTKFNLFHPSALKHPSGSKFIRLLTTMPPKYHLTMTIVRSRM